MFITFFKTFILQTNIIMTGNLFRPGADSDSFVGEFLGGQNIKSPGNVMNCPENQ